MDAFLREHNLISYLVVSCSAQLWGKITLGTVLSQVPINVVFVKKIVYRHEQSAENSLALNLLFSLIVAVQGLVLVFIFAPLGWAQKISHSPEKFIPRLMLLLNTATKNGAKSSRWLSTVFKYNDLYGRLLRGPKIGASVATLYTITYLSFFEVSF